MNRRLKTGAICTLVLIFSSINIPSFAAIQCSGKISQSYVDWDGNLIVLPSWRGDFVRLCNIRQSQTGDGKTIDPVTCKGWFAEVLAAVAADKGTVVFYDGIASCSTVPTYYSSPLPNYVLIAN